MVDSTHVENIEIIADLISSHDERASVCALKQMFLFYFTHFKVGYLMLTRYVMTLFNIFTTARFDTLQFSPKANAVHCWPATCKNCSPT